ncbi:ABC transporter substrate-binding protein [Compostimonas suwonensis]|uniref:Multiple sugar transport system substrate-binding protein n=1 Tax=Compostimonas suwonensis TaxID=1048394 RepID=A0A2M9BD10_9MICO|nr:sugar ABC transporter substrate-binding protein [Compostimonas suwonensis]PJJ55794.1 multiple sugar transport system substrate-binding protein [Compostimonas suwonensis]
MRIQRSKKRVAAVGAAIVVSALALAGCSTNPGESGGSSDGAPVELSFWGWAAGYGDSVELWNESHPDIQVTYEDGSNYDKLLNAANAGTAPCLAQIGYETFQTFLAADALQNINDYVADSRGDFADWVWENVGINGDVYGVPVDTAPMGTFYRKDLFEKAGIAVPTTWEEFTEAAKQIVAYDPNARIMNLPTDAYLYSGFAWQAEASWFGTDDDAWTVGIDDAANQEVGAYWQGLKDADLVTAYPSFDAALYSAWSNGQVWAEVGPVWSASLIRDNSAASSGSWAVAPMPRWGTDDLVGNSGGSSTAVMKDCEHPKEATEFALWMSTNEDSVSNLIEAAAILPASNQGLENPALDEPVEYYGGQPIYQVFRDEAAKVAPGWQWGPVMSVTAPSIADGLGKVAAGSGTYADALAGAQAASVDALKSQGFAVAE